MFQMNERAFYRTLREPAHPVSGASNRLETPQFPEAGEATEFWSDLLSTPAPFTAGEWYVRQAEYYEEHVPVQSSAVITQDILADCLRKLALWRAPGHDKLHGYWWKRLTSLHSYLRRAFQRVIDGHSDIPGWLTSGATTLLPKTSPPSAMPKDYRPITCLPIQYKLFTAAISKIMCQHINQHEILATEQRGCAAAGLGCKEHLMVDKMILEDAHTKGRNLVMAYLDFKKAFDSVSHEWILHALTMYRFHPSLVTTIARSMRNWRTTMHICDQGRCRVTTGNISIRRGIFQGDTLSPLLFCLALNPISFELNRLPLGYRVSCRDAELSINHSWYMDDIKLYGKTTKDVTTLVSTVCGVGDDISMNLNPAKCAVLHVRRGKPDEGCSIQVGDETIAESLRLNETYKYLGVVQAAMIPHPKLKTQLTAEYKKRLYLLLNSGLNARNMIKAINTYALPVMTYSYGIVNWTEAEIKTTDRVTRSALTASGFHHPKASVNRLYMKRGDGGRGLVSCEDMHGRSMCDLARYMSTSPIDRISLLYQYHQQKPTTKSHSITAKAAKFLSSLDLPAAGPALPNKHTIKQACAERKSKTLSTMPLHGRYWSRLEENRLDKELTFMWLKSRTLKPSTEGMIMAAQDQSLKTKNYQYAIMKSIPRTDANCRLCKGSLETIDHIVSACPVLARTSYIERHNRIVKYVHFEMCKARDLPTGASRFDHQLKALVKSNQYRLYWEYSVPTDLKLSANRPDLLLVDDKERIAYIIDISVPGENNINKKMAEKRSKYYDLKREISRIWSLNQVDVVPVVVGALGGLVGETPQCLRTVQGGDLAIVQQEAIQGSIKILRTILNM